MLNNRMHMKVKVAIRIASVNTVRNCYRRVSNRLQCCNCCAIAYLELMVDLQRNWVVEGTLGLDDLDPLL